MSEERLIPETIVKLLFDQIKSSADTNTSSIQKLGDAINEITKVQSSLAIKKDLIDEIKGLDGKESERLKYLIRKIEKTEEILGTRVNGVGRKVEDEEDSINKIEIIEKKVDGIEKKVDDISSKIKTMITVVIVSFALLLGVFYFVKSATDVSVRNAIEGAVKEIITTRPSNIYPPSPGGR
jgi:hypothetical protein